MRKPGHKLIGNIIRGRPPTCIFVITVEVGSHNVKRGYRHHPVGTHRPGIGRPEISRPDKWIYEFGKIHIHPGLRGTERMDCGKRKHACESKRRYSRFHRLFSLTNSIISLMRPKAMQTHVSAAP